MAHSCPTPPLSSSPYLPLSAIYLPLRGYRLPPIISFILSTSPSLSYVYIYPFPWLPPPPSRPLVILSISPSYIYLRGSFLLPSSLASSPYFPRSAISPSVAVASSLPSSSSLSLYVTYISLSLSSLSLSQLAMSDNSIRILAFLHEVVSLKLYFRIQRSASRFSANYFSTIRLRIWQAEWLKLVHICFNSVFISRQCMPDVIKMNI